jgi:hypothetical protein
MDIKIIDDMFLLELFPWTVWENFNNSSINVDLDNLIRQKDEIYEINIFLTNYDNRKQVRYFIWGSSLNSLEYLRWFYNHLFKNNVSYTNIIDDSLFEFNVFNQFYTAWLKNIHYFQMKKPWINDISQDYQSSNRIFAEIINEFSSFIWNNEILRIKFNFKGTSYSKLLKHICFNFKELFIKNERQIEELESNFSDKLSFFLWKIHLFSNTKREKELEGIINKNFSTYDNKFNWYRVKKSNRKLPTFLFNQYHKYQSDILLNHWNILAPFDSNFIKKNRVLIIPYSQPFIEDNYIF